MTVPTLLKNRPARANKLIQFDESTSHPLKVTKQCPYCLQEHLVNWISIHPLIISVPSKGNAPQESVAKLQQECCFFQSLAHGTTFHPVLNEFFTMIIDQFNHRLQVQEYVHDLSISHQYLDKLCKYQVGSTLHNLVTRRNLLDIKIQLIKSDDSIKDICSNLGYTEVTNFSKFFKKYTGVTPCSYRNELSMMMC